jgi:hypothetical protein
MKTGLFAWLAIGAIICCRPVWADSMEAVQQERQQLEQESLRVESACYDRFAVNACLAEWSAKRRGRVAELRKRELALQELARAERTRAQLQALEQKRAEQLERSAEIAGRSPVERAEKLAPTPAPASRDGTGNSDNAITPAQAAANRQAFEARATEAARRKEELERRLQENTDRATGLPVPP